MYEPTVFIVDNDRASRTSLKRLVASIGLKAKSFAEAERFLTAYDPDMPGCLVLEVRIPDMSGLQLQELLAQQGAGISIVFVTGFADVSTAVRALKKGAIDFIEKPYSNQQILDAIQGGIRRDRQAREVAEERKAVLSRVAQLTNRERQVLEMVTEGKSNKEIARELQLSLKTVENHRGKMKDKMQATSIASLVRMMVRVLEHDELIQKSVIDEKQLTKGELRKLNSLRKSIGSEIGDAAFAKWLEQKQASEKEALDPTAAVIEEALGKVVHKLKFPRGSRYQIRRGRARINVERLE